jgi:hypothetical protein
MAIAAVEIQPLAIDVAFSGDMLQVELADGRAIGVPLEWFPDLQAASIKDRKNWQLIGGGLGIRWEALDEDVSIESLLRLR